jgi:hypothetical protein
MHLDLYPQPGYRWVNKKKARLMKVVADMKFPAATWRTSASRGAEVQVGECLWFQGVSTAGFVLLFAQMSYSSQQSEGGVRSDSCRDRLHHVMMGMVKPAEGESEWILPLSLCDMEGLQLVPEIGFLGGGQYIRLKVRGLQVDLRPLRAVGVAELPNGHVLMEAIGDDEYMGVLDLMRRMFSKGRKLSWCMCQVVWCIGQRVDQLHCQNTAVSTGPGVDIADPDDRRYQPNVDGSRRHRASQLVRYMKATQRRFEGSKNLSWSWDASQSSGRSILLSAVMDCESGVTAWAPPQVLWGLGGSAPRLGLKGAQSRHLAPRLEVGGGLEFRGGTLFGGVTYFSLGIYKNSVFCTNSGPGPGICLGDIVKNSCVFCTPKGGPRKELTSPGP